MAFLRKLDRPLLQTIGSRESPPMSTVDPLRAVASGSYSASSLLRQPPFLRNLLDLLQFLLSLPDFFRIILAKPLLEPL